jgi:hypothetical protein
VLFGRLSDVRPDAVPERRKSFPECFHRLAEKSF